MSAQRLARGACGGLTFCNPTFLWAPFKILRIRSPPFRIPVSSEVSVRRGEVSEQGGGLHGHLRHPWGPRVASQPWAMEEG